MGNAQGLGLPEEDNKKNGEKKEDKQEKPRGPAPPTRGRKKRKNKGAIAGAGKMPTGTLTFQYELGICCIAKYRYPLCSSSKHEMCIA